jgi:tetratricopeptide (TPR) repeat protein/transcriptional regulator with XRE-family HTH domain
MQRSETSSPQPRIRLTEARQDAGYSQQEVADRIGTTYVNISRWERGITKPGPYFRRKLCELFGKTEAELDLSLEGKTKGRGAETATQQNTTTPPAPQAVLNGPLPIYDTAIPLPPAIPLVGREHDLKRIKQKLFGGGSVALTALNGLPGVGKTALSITLAHDEGVRSHFLDGVLWAGLGPNPNMPGLLSRWGTLLGISATQMATLNNPEAWGKAIRAAIGARKMLLVIDDAWQLEEALAFRVGGTNCAHLVTTRFPNIAAHMTVDGAMLIEELGEEESIKLLRLLAPQVVTREEQKVHDLVQVVGGLPLALTLMGNYLRKQAYSGPARRISAALERLNDAEVRLQISEPHVPVESHPSLPVEISLSLQSVISVTDQLLSESARKTLYALSVFPPKPNTFSEEAALAVAACTLDELDALCDAGMLESNGVDRYHLHQVIADYARFQLPEALKKGAFERLVAFVTDYVETHKKDYEQLEVESGTILAGLDAAQEVERKEELVKSACGFAPFLLARGQYAVAEKHLQQALNLAMEVGDDHGTTAALLYLGEATEMQGNFEQAETHLQKGLGLARQVIDNENVCALLTTLGRIRWKRGDLALAETYLQEGLTLAHQIDNIERTCGILRVLGSVASNLGNYDQSETYLREGLDLARQISDREQICTLLINLGATVGAQGNQAEAEQYFQEGLAIARQTGLREQRCVALINLGDLATQVENYTLAEKYFEEGLTLSRQLGHREWVSALLINLGENAYKQKNYKQAESYLDESITLAREIDRSLMIVHAFHIYGNLHLDQDHIQEAKKAFTEMLDHIPDGGRELIALAYYGLARVAAQTGDIDEARKKGEASLTNLKSIENHKAEEIEQWLRLLPSDKK